LECTIPVDEPDGSVIGTHKPFVGGRQTIATSIALLGCAEHGGCIPLDCDLSTGVPSNSGNAKQTTDWLAAGQSIVGAKPS
jgi:hypothetical protein